MTERYGDSFKKVIVDSLPTQIPYGFFGNNILTFYEEYTCTGLEADEDTIKLLRLPLNCKVLEVMLICPEDIGGDMAGSVGAVTPGTVVLDVDMFIPSTTIGGATPIVKMSDAAATMLTGHMVNLGDQSIGTTVPLNVLENGRDVVLKIDTLTTAPTAGKKIKVMIYAATL